MDEQGQGADPALISSEIRIIAQHFGEDSFFLSSFRFWPHFPPLELGGH